MPFGLESLVEPPPDLVDEVERRESRVLATLLLLMLVFGAAFLAGHAALLQDSDLGWNWWAFGIGLVAYAATAGAYALTRRGRGRAGAMLLVTVIVVGSWTFEVTGRAAGLGSSGMSILVGAIVAVAFLRPRETAVVHLLNLLFLSVHQLVVPVPVAEWVLALLVYAVAFAALTARRLLTDASLRELDRYATEWRAVMENNDAAIVSLDTQYRLRSFNHAAQEVAQLCGFAPLKAGRSVFHLAPPALHAVFVGLTAPALRGETVHETRVLPSQNGELEVDVTVKPLRSRDGAIVGTSGLIRDVTEERRLREDAEERIARTRSAVLNAASHELNTPLTPLVIQLTLLRQGHLGPVPDNQRAALDTMDRSVRHLRRNVEAFLHATRLEQALTHTASEVVDLSALARQWADDKGSGVVEGLAVDRGVRVVGDPRMLYVALRSLVDTLLRWSRQERVSVSVTSRRGEAVLVVADPESTVDSEDVEAMEDLLGEAARLVGYARLLSLHVARRVVDHHGGHLEMRHDEGLRLEAHLPLAPRSLEPGEAPAMPKDVSDAEDLLPPRTNPRPG